jgi:hypothetical protein
MRNLILTFILLLIITPNLISQDLPGGEEALGSKTYDQYEKPEACKAVTSIFTSNGPNR